MFACVVPAVAAAGDGADLPATKAGEFVGEWLELCQPPPELEQLRVWYAANLSAAAAKRKSVEDRARDDVDLCTAQGGLRIRQVTTPDPGTITLLTQGSNSGLWFAGILSVTEAGKIAKTGHWPTSPPESELPKDLSDAAIARELKRTLAKLSQLGMFSGIVMVARGTWPMASTSIGYADRARRALITSETQFTLGSLGKTFTAVSVGQLIDQGKLSLADRVGKFFPDYPNKTVRGQVTLGMLLSHMSGLDDFLDRRTPEMMKNGVRRADEFMPLYDRDEPKFPPGTAVSYSNAGLALAGAIVEKVSGEDYPEYLRRHIFAAAGMIHSDPNNIPHRTPTLVTPYTKMQAPGSSRDYWHEGASHEWHEAERDIGSPAGGAISTAEDLVRFAAALRSGKLVSAATFALLTSPHPGSPDYGYGFEIEQTYGRTLAGHTGGFPGVNASWMMVLNSPYTIVVLSNRDPPSAEYAATAVNALVAEKAKLEK
jgi:CubicO group peptidase (beta-lactamase class C family)